MNKVTLLLKISHNAIYYTTNKHKLAPLETYYCLVFTPLYKLKVTPPTESNQ